MNDITLQLETLQKLKKILAKNSTYEAVLTSLTTLLCENFFAEMRQTYPMPLVHQFAISFTSCTQEMIKRLTTKSFHYYTTNDPTYYSRPSVGFIQDIPVMPKIKPATKPHAKDLAKMKSWANEVGQSVRQVTVRNFSTKEKPGTLPYWVYEMQHSQPEANHFQAPDVKSDSGIVVVKSATELIFIHSFIHSVHSKPHVILTFSRTSSDSSH